MMLSSIPAWNEDEKDKKINETEFDNALDELEMFKSLGL